MIAMRDVLVEDARRRELLREADRYRLAKQVPARRSPTLPASFRPLVIRLGELLVTWGHWLQAKRPTPV